MMRALAAVVCVAALLGCEPANQASPARIPDGVTQITKPMRGVWNAPGGPGCVWSVRVKSGDRWVTVNKGSGNRSQTVILGTSTVGGQLRSNKCKGWTR